MNYSLNFHEKKQHGTADFPAEYYYVDKDYPQYHMPFHWHKEWELIRIVRGELALQADEQEYSARPGDVFLLRDGMLHGGSPICTASGGSPEDCVYECFVFDLHDLFRDVNSVKKYLRPFYRGQLLPWISYPGGQSDICSIVSELMEEASRSAAARSAASRSGTSRSAASASGPAYPYELSALGNLSRLFALILEKGYYFPAEDARQSGSGRIAQLKTVLEYIETHFSQKIGLEELARAAGMSPKYFCRFFRSITHQTPVDYVNRFRAEKAAGLLCSTDLSVTAVGLECGFNDSSYFVKSFRKYMGMTPKQYQRLNA